MFKFDPTNRLIRTAKGNLITYRKQLQFRVIAPQYSRGEVWHNPLLGQYCPAKLACATWEGRSIFHVS